MFFASRFSRNAVRTLFALRIPKASPRLALQTLLCFISLALSPVLMFGQRYAGITPPETATANSTSAPRILAIHSLPFEKSASQLQSSTEYTWNFEQVCPIPVSISRGVITFLGSDTTMRIAGLITDISISGPHASEFRIIRPNSFPVNIPAIGLGAPVEVQFNSSVDGIRTARATIRSTDLMGVPLPDIIVNLVARRGRYSFQTIGSMFDFGTLPASTPVERTFPWVWNDGTEPLQWGLTLNFNQYFTLANTRPAPTLEATPGQERRFLLTLQPGDTLFTTVRFNGREAGQTSEAAFAPLNRVCGTFQDFFVKAQTVQNPPNITVFRRTPTSDIAVRDSELYLGAFACPATDAPFKDTTLRIYNSGQVTLNVTGAMFNNPDFQIINPPVISPQMPIAVTFNTSREITVRYTPRNPSRDDIRAALTLISNAGNGTPVGSTTVNFRVRKDSVGLTVSRQAVDFGSVARGGTVAAQMLTLRNVGTIPISVRSFAGMNFLVNPAKQVLDPGEETNVTVQATNTSQAGVVREEWRITDDCGKVTVVALQLTVNRPAPTLGLAVPVNVGSLVCSSDTTVSFTISNTGNDANDLIITAMTIQGGAASPFAFVQTPQFPIVIASGQGRTFQIRFTPLRTGIATDVLRITSNADGNPVFNAPLNGSKDSVRFQVSRTNLSFVNALPNTSLSDTLTVFNTGTVPISWGAGTAFSNNPALFTVQVTPPVTPPGASSQVRITFLGSTADASGMLTLQDICGRAQAITVSASILRPYISATPTFSFGTLVCETSSSGQITIQNTGGQDLIVSAITPSSALFTLQVPVLPLRIPRGADPVSIPVIFRPLPTTQGAIPGTISISSNAANGAVTTTTISALKNVVDFEFLDLTSSDAPNTLSRFLGSLAPNASTTQTVRLRNTGNLPLQWRLPVFSPDSLFVVESVAENPTPPGSITTMLLRYRGSSCPGLNITATGLQVFSNYGFDCNKTPARVTISAQTLPATARIWIDTLSVGIGDTFNLPIRIRNPQYLAEAGVTGFRIALRYNASLLTPRNVSVQGTITGEMQTQEYTLPLPQPIPQDSIFARLPFLATLGSTSGTRISIDTLQALVPQGASEKALRAASCVIFDTSGARSRFTLLRICTEGSERLVTSATWRTTLAQARPNPSSTLTTLDFSLLERGETTITIFNVMGDKILQALSKQLEPGEYSLELDVSRLTSGVYFYVLQTPTERKIRRMEVIR